MKARKSRFRLWVLKLVVRASGGDLANTAKVCRHCRCDIWSNSFWACHVGPLCEPCAKSRYEHVTGKTWGEGWELLRATNELLGADLKPGVPSRLTDKRIGCAMGEPKAVFGEAIG